MIAYVVTIFSLLMGAFANAQAGALPKSIYDRRPHLMIDGKALAENLFGDICKDTRIFSSKYRHRSLLTSGWKGLLSKKVDENLQNESELISWIKSQPLNSIDPLKLAHQAIEMENGNVLHGLRLSYNVLSEARRVRVGLARNRKPQPDFFNHLVDVTGERELMREFFARNPSVPGGVSTRGSKNSTWYHLFGAAMIAYDEGMKEPPRIFPKKWAETIAELQGKVVTYPMIAIENIGDSRADSEKRYLNNYEGAKFGAALARLVKRGHHQGCSEDKTQAAYLRDRPEALSIGYELRYGRGQR